LKFTPSGGTISVGWRIENGLVLVEVADTGVGIAPSQLERIFDPFVQVQAGTTRTSEGVGLGLAISRDMARQMGGDVSVKSDLGKGSTFTLALPEESQ
jgi:signal transduction histidine kinase